MKLSTENQVRAIDLFIVTCKKQCFWRIIISKKNLFLLSLVATMTYDSETCADKSVRVQVATPFPFLRYGCLEMMFKTYGRCYVNLSNDIQRLQHYRPNNGQWVRIKRTLNHSGNKVRILIFAIFFLFVVWSSTQLEFELFQVPWALFELFSTTLY